MSLKFSWRRVGCGVLLAVGLLVFVPQLWRAARPRPVVVSLTLTDNALGAAASVLGGRGADYVVIAVAVVQNRGVAGRVVCEVTAEGPGGRYRKSTAARFSAGESLTLRVEFPEFGVLDGGRVTAQARAFPAPLW